MHAFIFIYSYVWIYAYIVHVLHVYLYTYTHTYTRRHQPIMPKFGVIDRRLINLRAANVIEKFEINKQQSETV